MQRKRFWISATHSSSLPGSMICERSDELVGSNRQEQLSSRRPSEESRSSACSINRNQDCQSAHKAQVYRLGRPAPWTSPSSTLRLAGS